MKNKTNDELVETIGETVIGTPSGLSAQHAQAEITKRLIDSIEKFNITTSESSERVLRLSWAVLVIALAQLMVSVFSLPVPVLFQLIIWITLVLYLVYQITNFGK